MKEQLTSLLESATGEEDLALVGRLLLLKHGPNVASLDLVSVEEQNRHLDLRLKEPVTVSESRSLLSRYGLPIEALDVVWTDQAKKDTLRYKFNLDQSNYTLNVGPILNEGTRSAR